MNVIRIGILGFAHGHVCSYCSRWQNEPELGMRVVAGWDHDAGRLAGNCETFEIDAAASPEELLARSDVDAVAIAAETSMHADLVEKAAAAGKAIIVQKPMALTLEQADRIVAAVSKAGVPFTMAWQMRVDPHNVQAKELLESGNFGRVFMVRRRHCLGIQGAGPEFHKSWHVTPEFNRDIFADDASHPIDFLHWLLGMPVSVTAELGTLGGFTNDNGIAIFRYADGTFAEASCTFVEVTGENCLEIICEKGTIIGNYGDGPSSGVPRPPGAIQFKWFLAKDGNWTISDVPEVAHQGVRIANLAGPLSEFLHGTRPPICTAEEGRDSLRMVLACYESAEQGRRIAL